MEPPRQQPTNGKVHVHHPAKAAKLLGSFPSAGNSPTGATAVSMHRVHSALAARCAGRSVRNVFRAMDRAKRGALTRDDFRTAVDILGVQLQPAEVDAVFQAAASDSACDGRTDAPGAATEPGKTALGPGIRYSGLLRMLQSEDQPHNTSGPVQARLSDDPALRPFGQWRRAQKHPYLPRSEQRAKFQRPVYRPLNLNAAQSTVDASDKAASSAPRAACNRSSASGSISTKTRSEEKLPPRAADAIRVLRAKYANLPLNRRFRDWDVDKMGRIDTESMSEALVRLGIHMGDDHIQLVKTIVSHFNGGHGKEGSSIPSALSYSGMMRMLDKPDVQLEPMLRPAAAPRAPQQSSNQESKPLSRPSLPESCSSSGSKHKSRSVSHDKAQAAKAKAELPLQPTTARDVPGANAKVGGGGDSGSSDKQMHVKKQALKLRPTASAARKKREPHDSQCSHRTCESAAHARLFGSHGQQAPRAQSAPSQAHAGKEKVHLQRDAVRPSRKAKANTLSSQHYGSSQAVDYEDRALRAQRRAARLHNIRTHRQRVADAHSDVREREQTLLERRVHTLAAQRKDYENRLQPRMRRDERRVAVYNKLYTGW